MSDPYRILVIDDDDTIRSSLSILLEEEGYVVDAAEDAKEAIAKSNANFFNLAIVDWRLPDIEGTKLLGILKETTPKMAKIMLTGYASTKNAIEAVNKRADAFFQKPVNPEALLQGIAELLATQDEVRQHSEEKVAQFIEARSKLVAKKRG